MAIKFVDKDPAPERSSKGPSVAREPDAEALGKSVEPELPHAEPETPDARGGASDGQLPFAKSDPKPRGRKKPLR